MDTTVVEEATPAAGGFREIRVRLLPGLAHQIMTRAAALHLYRLLQRYNWCLEDVKQYRARWGDFWPMISAIERKVMALFVRANCNGVFGIRLQVKGAPADFEQYEGDRRPVKISACVAKEFRRLLTLHYERLTGPNELREWLECRRPKEYAAVVGLGLEQEMFRGRSGLHPDLVGEHCEAACVAAGWDRRAAVQLAFALAGEIERFFNFRERTLC